jgi:hypothetical protein
MLSNWSSPFPHEESNINMIKKRTTRPKLLNPKQLENNDDDNELQDYVPMKEFRSKDKMKDKKEKEEKEQEEKEKEKEKIEKENFMYDYPNYDKPFEYTTYSKDAQLLEKLNYMIHLLEEQKDERTGHVTEELILYIFLGVFVLFVLDSFFKTGKYSR